MTVAQHIAQLRQLDMEHPEASNLPIVVEGIGMDFEARHHDTFVGFGCRRPPTCGTAEEQE